MKKIVAVSLGGYSFQLEEDACQTLNSYLEAFRSCLSQTGDEAEEVMQDVETRIAELFLESLSSPIQVVGMGLVNHIVEQLGMPDGEKGPSSNGESKKAKGYSDASADETPVHRLFRSQEDVMLGGVANGLAIYFNIDVVLVRIIWTISLFCGGLGFWAYLIMWICVPVAKTPVQKLQHRGLPVTAENLLKYSKR